MLKTSEIPHELRPINKLFSAFGYEFDISILFDDLLTITICTMGRGTNEKLYLETIKKYKRKHLDIFAGLFCELVKLYEKHKQSNDWCDPLGDYYEALATKYKKSAFGQFFTPKEICTFMASLIIEPDKWGTDINEPCVGSGRNVMAINAISEGNYYICQDLDPVCCKMTAINLCFHNIRAEIHCMDTLKNSTPIFSYSVNYEFWKHKKPVIFMYTPS